MTGRAAHPTNKGRARGRIRADGSPTIARGRPNVTSRASALAGKARLFVTGGRKILVTRRWAIVRVRSRPKLTSDGKAKPTDHSPARLPVGLDFDEPNYFDARPRATSLRARCARVRRRRAARRRTHPRRSLARVLRRAQRGAPVPALGARARLAVCAELQTRQRRARDLAGSPPHSSHAPRSVSRAPTVLRPVADRNGSVVDQERSGVYWAI